MTHERTPTDAAETPLNPPGAEGDELAAELAGQQREGDQVAYLRLDEVDDLGSGLGHVEMYEGELEAGVHDDLPGEPKAENLELLTELELREGETGNPDVAAEEGLTYIPPMDPPVVPDPDDPQGIRVAAGFGTTALDEPYDMDHHSDTITDDDEMGARVHEALRADAATSTFADRIVVGTRGGMIVLRGRVPDVTDTDEAVAVVERVRGVTEVVDEMEVEALEG
jgi:hypothetical protein